MQYKIIIFFIFLICFFSFDAFATLPVQYDSSDVQVRVPKSAEITKIKQDKDFNYKLESTPDDSILDWLRYKFYKLLEIVFSDRGPVVAIRWVLIILFLVFIILKILKVSPQSLFYKQKKTQFIPSGEFDEDISVLNFENLISEAVASGNFKKAVRYMYLKLLKILSDQNRIEWSAYKTNHDYHREMSGSPFNQDFRKLSSVFEFTWYGDFSLSQITFEKTQTEFWDFYEKLNK